MVLTSTPKAVKISDVSKRTLRNRNQFLKNQLKITSGPDPVDQAANFVKSFRGEEQEDLMKKADLIVPSISAEQMVAIKVDTGIPWEKLKKLSRYYSAYKD